MLLPRKPGTVHKKKKIRKYERNKIGKSENLIKV
jgi:hypothetical protein